MFSSPQASSPSCRQTRTKRGTDIKSLAKKVALHVKRKIELSSSNTTIIDGRDMEAAIFQPEREHKVIMTLPLQQKPSSQSKLWLEFAMSWLMSTFNVGQMHINPTMSLQKYANIQWFILMTAIVKPAGPKGLRAASARAFTGRRNSYSGRGEDFFSRQPNFFTETAVTPERKVEKWFPRWEINRHAEG